MRSVPTSPLARLEAAGHEAAGASERELAAVGWLTRAPDEYAAYLRRFGGRKIEVAWWTLPAVSGFAEMEAAFRDGGAPANLVPFAEQDGTWFMAFDLADHGAIVEWDHESLSAEPFAGTFATWLATLLDAEAEGDREEAEAAGEQRRWALDHVPFSSTPLGEAAAARLGAPAGASLRDVLLDLHLQYAFHPRAVQNAGLIHVGLLHFTDSTIGCWRCGRMSQKAATACVGCGEALLRRTFEEALDLPRETTAWAPCFGLWAAAHVDLDKPRPILVTTPAQPRGIPGWARLPAFGGTRDPRVPAAAEGSWW